MECVYAKQYKAGATRIRAHILVNKPAVGATACLSPSARATAAMQKIDHDLQQRSLKKRKAVALDDLERAESSKRGVQIELDD